MALCLTNVQMDSAHVLALHMQMFACMSIIMHMLASSGAWTTAGWEAGVERSRLDENLGAATGRGSKPAAERLGRTGGLAAAAAYELRWAARAEEAPTLQEGSKSSSAVAAAGSGASGGAADSGAAAAVAAALDVATSDASGSIVCERATSALVSLAKLVSTVASTA